MRTVKVKISKVKKAADKKKPVKKQSKVSLSAENKKVLDIANKMSKLLNDSKVSDVIALKATAIVIDSIRIDMGMNPIDFYELLQFTAMMNEAVLELAVKNEKEKRNDISN